MTHFNEDLLFGFLIGLFAGYALRSWQRGFTERMVNRSSRKESQAKSTQKNIYGRICNEIMLLCVSDLPSQRKSRGVQCIPLGIQEDGTYLINLFWQNEFHSLGILSIRVHTVFVFIASMEAPCPQGKKRSYRTLSLSDESVRRVIWDVEQFIFETYQVSNLPGTR